uniref:G-patch domain-containing protein n=1 Tax=Lotharella oceanica TaxID=641309 RepID=A0A7S2TU85_9EUKA
MPSQQSKQEEKAAILRRLALLSHKLGSKKRELAAKNSPRKRQRHPSPIRRPSPTRRDVKNSRSNARQTVPRMNTNGSNESQPNKRQRFSGTTTPSSSGNDEKKRCVVKDNGAGRVELEPVQDTGGGRPIGKGEFFLDYSTLKNKAPVDHSVPEETGVPCSNWPRCRFQNSCKYAHPTQAQLRKRGCGPLTLEDVTSLVVRFKNNTVGLNMLHTLISARLGYAAQLWRKKKPEITRDALLAVMCLPGTRDILLEFARAAKEDKSKTDGFKVTSDKEFTKGKGGYFAVIKMRGEFLVRYYSTKGPAAGRGGAAAVLRQQSERERQQANSKRESTSTKPWEPPRNSKPLKFERVNFVKMHGEPTEEDEIEESNLMVLMAPQLSDKNKGFKMLKTMGWSEGKGLGSKGQGRKEPVPVRFTLTRSF